jgi:hypothetical protein
MRSAGVIWLWGRCQIWSHRLLTSWHRMVTMPVAPVIVQRMPDNFRRCPTSDLHPASTTPEPMNMPSFLKSA